MVKNRPSTKAVGKGRLNRWLRGEENQEVKVEADEKRWRLGLDSGYIWNTVWCV